jgi:hypothetical protein
MKRALWRIALYGECEADRATAEAALVKADEVFKHAVGVTAGA